MRGKIFSCTEIPVPSGNAADRRSHRFILYHYRQATNKDKFTHIFRIFYRFPCGTPCSSVFQFLHGFTHRIGRKQKAAFPREHLHMTAHIPHLILCHNKRLLSAGFPYKTSIKEPWYNNPYFYIVKQKMFPPVWRSAAAGTHWSDHPAVTLPYCLRPPAFLSWQEPDAAAFRSSI